MKTAEEWESVFISSTHLNLKQWAKMVQGDVIQEYSPILEALRFTIKSSVENGPEAIAECIDRLEQALAIAEKIQSQ